MYLRVLWVCVYIAWSGWALVKSGQGRLASLTVDKLHFSRQVGPPPFLTSKEPFCSHVVGKSSLNQE